MVPVSSSSNSLCVQSNEQPACPITLMPFERPWILLEDGFTYEKSAIETWLKTHPNRSPMIGEISSSTIQPNVTALQSNPTCPITREPFNEPYYCVEDSQTYEKDAIIKWFEIKVRENLDQGGILPFAVTSPVNGLKFGSLTLYPNKIFFKRDLPKDQKPIVLEIDISGIIHDPMESRNCIFDAAIRSLLTCFSNEKDNQKRMEFKELFDKRRQQLGLGTTQTMFDSLGQLDLSNLNLSNMNLENLNQKCCITKDSDLSNTVLKNCSFSRSQFINCNLSGTVFINCDFKGEQTSFFKSDMKNAVIESHCVLEKGYTWEGITSWREFKRELVSRGAINVDSVSLRV